MLSFNTKEDTLFDETIAQSSQRLSVSIRSRAEEPTKMLNLEKQDKNKTKLVYGFKNISNWHVLFLDKF
ncbi:MAG: hypothetical protein K0R24_1841 [Gammaproteobacteria bacterium]|jgi:hypothetical protein|nr:hypothetical protein [Gammaproteobacteria bacterium]